MPFDCRLRPGSGFMRHVARLLVLTALGACDAPPESGRNLPALGAEQLHSVSGISAGGYLAGQYQLAFGSDVAGAAIIAAGPWGCAGGELEQALGPCIDGQGIDVDALAAAAEQAAEAGRIDPLGSLADDRVLLYRGTEDSVIGAGTVAAAADFLARYLPPQAILQVDDVPAAHAWVTDGYGAACDVLAPPFINDCGTSIAAQVLEQLYGPQPGAADGGGKLQAFDQAAYGADASLAETGYVYIPDACADGACRVHVFFHGCQQSAATIGDTLAANAGFNELAAMHRLIVLYPQVAPSRVAPLNPLGCWDWWGYTGADYLSREAPQLAAVRAMVAALQVPPAGR